ncbi:MAG: hypothetical protein ACRDZY_08535, partial [Acidimicrobiales bacterium]
IWIGGGVILAGTALAAFPGRRRRRPTDPVSGAVASAGAGPAAEGDTAGSESGLVGVGSTVDRRARFVPVRARRQATGA